MPIPVSCDHCGRHYHVKTKLAGQRFRCRDCDRVILVPAPAGEQAELNSGDNSPPSDEVTLTQSLPASSVAGLPATSTSSSATTDPLPLPSPSKSLRSRRKKSRWKTLIVSTAGLSLVAAIAAFKAHTGEQGSDTNGKAVVASSEETSPEDELTAMQSLLDDKVKPENLTLSVADVVEEVQQQDNAQHLPWQDFLFPGQPISISMPGQPRPLIRTQEGITVRGAGVNSRSEPGGDFSILLINFKVPPGESIDVDRHLEETKQGMLDSTPFGRLTGEHAISIIDEGGNEHPGREFEFEGTVLNKEMNYTYRIYMVGTRMIISITAVERQHAGEFEQNSTRFLDSLRITAAIPPINSHEQSETSAAD